MHSETHHYEWCSIYIFELRTLSQGQKLILPLDAGRATMNFAVCMSQQTILEELLLSKKEHNWTWMIMLNCCSVCTTILVLIYLQNMAWHSVAESWLNHGRVHGCMWAGQQVLSLLQNLFKQSKLSLRLTLARGKSWGSYSNYNWDPWVPRIAEFVATAPEFVATARINQSFRQWQVYGDYWKKSKRKRIPAFN